MILKPIENPAQETVVAEFPFVIGRLKECHLYVDDNTVSKPHAAIVERAGGLHLFDLGSHNGTWVLSSPTGQGDECRAVPRVDDPAQVPEDLCRENCRLTNGCQFAVGRVMFSVALCDDSSGGKTLPGASLGEEPDAPQPAETRTPSLVVIRGPELGRRLQLESLPVTLGSSPEKAGISLAGTRLVSRSHIRISRDAAGRLRMEDLGSKNGTVLNGRRVHAETLKDGDEIALADEVVLKVVETQTSRSSRSWWLGAGVLATALLALVVVAMATSARKRHAVRVQVDHSTNAVAAITRRASQQPAAAVEKPESPERPSPRPAAGASPEPEIAAAGKYLLTGWEQKTLEVHEQALKALSESGVATPELSQTLTDVSNRLESVRRYTGAIAALASEGSSQEVEELLSQAVAKDGAHEPARLALDWVTKHRDTLDKVRSTAATNSIERTEIRDMVDGLPAATLAGAESTRTAVIRRVEQAYRAPLEDAMSRARRAMQSGQALEALRLVRFCLRLTPWNTEAREMLGSLQPEARRALTDMMLEAYQLENAPNADAHVRAQQLYAQVLDLSDADDWSRDIRESVKGRVRK